MKSARELLSTSLDPRMFQIAALSLLLAHGVLLLDFDVAPLRVALIISAALSFQWLCTLLWRLPRFDPKSALISALSLCLLLRTDSAAIALLAVVLTITSKFVIRVGGKHVFNPTDFGIIAAMLLTRAVWVSPGQWGNTAFFGFLMLCIGSLVVNRAARSDVTWAFLIFYVAMVLGRFAWLGDPLAIPLHRLQSGALLLFAFFMISDPKTTPDARGGRIVFAFLVAALSYYVQFKLFRSDALLWALVAVSPLVPAIDFVFPGRRYDWGQATRSITSHEGESDAKTPLAPVAVPARALGAGA